MGMLARVAFAGIAADSSVATKVRAGPGPAQGDRPMGEGSAPPVLFWIAGTEPGRLAIVSRPRGGVGLAAEMAALRRAGVDTVVSLLETAEALQLGLQLERAACESNGLAFVSFPIADLGVPRSVAMFVALVTDLAAKLRTGRTVAVHCRASIGRSGLLTSALLIAHGQTLSSAVRVVGEARGAEVPETPQQAAWLRRHQRRFRG